MSTRRQSPKVHKPLDRKVASAPESSANGPVREQELLAAAGELTSLENVSQLLGLPLPDVEARQRAGILLALATPQGDFAFPTWQFEGNRLLPGLDQVLADLRVQNPRPWAQVRFLLTPNIRLDGATPLDELRRGHLEQVRRASRTYGEHGAA